jgi:hypothetical protein
MKHTAVVSSVVMMLLAAGLIVNACGEDVPRSGVTDTVSLDTSRLQSSNCEVRQYISQENLPSMVFPYLWAPEGMPVTYAIAQGAINDVVDGGDILQVQQAAATWSTIPNCSFSFAQTSFDGFWGLADGSNEIGWIYDDETWTTTLGLPSNAIAVNYSFRSGSTYSEFDILLNGVYFWWYADSNDPYYGSQYGAMNVGHIALHEMGHSAGLTDLYNSGDGYEAWMGTGNEGATMYGYSDAHDEDVTLSSMDMDAMRLAYPVPEPSTLVLLAIAAGGLLAWRQRQAA